MQRSETIGKLAEALAKAQGKIKGAVMDSENPFFSRPGRKAAYPTLAAVWDACREPLTTNGLSVAQGGVLIDGQLYLETLLQHSSGEWISSLLPVKPVKDDPQGLGSCLTYCERYGLRAMVGVPPVEGEDDDGNVASGKPGLNTKEASQEVARQKIAEGTEKIKAQAEAQKQAESRTETTDLPEGAKPYRTISVPQQKRLFAIAKSHGWTEGDIRDVVKGFGYEHTKEIPVGKYEQICNFFKAPQQPKDIQVDRPVEEDPSAGKEDVPW